MHYDLGWWLYGARQLERAIAEARFAIDLDPTFPEAYWLLAAAHAEQGRFDLGLQEFDRYESIYGGPVFWFRGYLLALAGRRQEAIRDLAELKRRVDQGASSPVELAAIPTRGSGPCSRSSHCRCRDRRRLIPALAKPARRLHLTLL